MGPVAAATTTAKKTKKNTNSSSHHLPADDVDSDLADLLLGHIDGVPTTKTTTTATTTTTTKKNPTSSSSTTSRSHGGTTTSTTRMLTKQQQLSPGAVNGTTTTTTTATKAAAAAMTTMNTTPQQQQRQAYHLMTNNNGSSSSTKSSSSSIMMIGDGRASGRSSAGASSCMEMLSSYTTLMCYYYPRLCCFLVFFIVFILMMMLGNVILNPLLEYGTIDHNYIHDAVSAQNFANVHSMYDLHMKDIDHWCLGGGNDFCMCEDPLQPLSRQDHRSWIEAVKMNRKILSDYKPTTTTTIQSSMSMITSQQSTPSSSSSGVSDIDVAFVGESIVEEMDGRWMGSIRASQDLRQIRETFISRFHRRMKYTTTAKYEGIALGVAGDTAPNVLWRLLNGELPSHLQPKVWWISVGNNDLGRMRCSEEIVVLGVLRIVEEILKQRPNSHIVINSLFPMMDIRGGVYPLIGDYRDSIIGQTTQTQTTQTTGRSTSATTSATTTTTISQQEEDEGYGQRQPRRTRGRRLLRRQQQQQGQQQQQQQQTSHQEQQLEQPQRRELLGLQQEEKQQSSQQRRRLLSTSSSSSDTSTTMSKYDILSADIEREELERQHEYHKKHRLEYRKYGSTNPKYLNNPRYHPQDPIMLDQDKIRRYRTATMRSPFTPRRSSSSSSLLYNTNTIPLWTSIRSINHELKLFADKHSDNVSFFDATELFVFRDDISTRRTRYRILTDRITTRGHLTPRGFVVWEDAIVSRLDSIMNMLRVSKPELFIETTTTTSTNEKKKRKKKQSQLLDDDEITDLIDDDYLIGIVDDMFEQQDDEEEEDDDYTTTTTSNNFNDDEFTDLDNTGFDDEILHLKNDDFFHLAPDDDDVDDDDDDDNDDDEEEEDDDDDEDEDEEDDDMGGPDE